MDWQLYYLVGRLVGEFAKNGSHRLLVPALVSIQHGVVWHNSITIMEQQSSSTRRNTMANNDMANNDMVKDSSPQPLANSLNENEQILS